jgi:hypothetical protein
MLCHLECDATGEVLCCCTAYNFAACSTAALELADALGSQPSQAPCNQLLTCSAPTCVSACSSAGVLYLIYLQRTYVFLRVQISYCRSRSQCLGRRLQKHIGVENYCHCCHQL